MALRTPTPRNSTDLQRGQCEDGTPYSNAITPECLTVSLGGAAGREATSKAGGIAYGGFVATAEIRATGFLGSRNLLRCPDVRLRNPYSFFRAGHLALVSLG